MVSDTLSASVRTLMFRCLLYDGSGQSGAGLFLAQRFWFTRSFSLFFISLLRFSVYFGSILVVGVSGDLLVSSEFCRVLAPGAPCSLLFCWVGMPPRLFLSLGT